MAMGVDYARQYVQHFGFRLDQIPNSLSMIAVTIYNFTNQIMFL